jgi:hypothetical protein
VPILLILILICLFPGGRAVVKATLGLVLILALLYAAKHVGS